MDHLPDELLLHVLTFLKSEDIARTQLVSYRFLRVARDNSFWKTRCFDESFNERRRRRTQLTETQSRYTGLSRLFGDVFQSSAERVQSKRSAAEAGPDESAAKARMRAFVNWDPTYPSEHINFYEEYIHRYGRVTNSWFETVQDGDGAEIDEREATGVAILYDRQAERAEKLYAALDDGSICIWDISTGKQSANQGRAVARTAPGILCANIVRSQDLGLCKAAMTSTGTVECVSIDHQTRKAYFAVRDQLTEVDLATLRVVSRSGFGFPINALSEANHPIPLTVGTSMTVQLYDPREYHRSPPLPADNVRLELIAGRSSDDCAGLRIADLTSKHALLSQPGPLSIVHASDASGSDEGSIWVAGRFTSLLHYDRRFFPRLRGTLHSAARISCLRSLPHTYLPRDSYARRDSLLTWPQLLEAKSVPGHSLIAAGEYKGKGSLELYSLPSDLSDAMVSSGSQPMVAQFKNRQTASSSKLLSVASHGGKLVVSDGDGNIRWMERDAFTPIRSKNINSEQPIFASTTTGYTFSQQHLNPSDDFVQLILPTMPRSSFGHSLIRDDNLVIWTGEGKLGLIGYGKPKWIWDRPKEDGLEDEDLKYHRLERQYAGEMGQALRRQQDELNFIRTFAGGFES